MEGKVQGTQMFLTVLEMVIGKFFSQMCDLTSLSCSAVTDIKNVFTAELQTDDDYKNMINHAAAARTDLICQLFSLLHFSHVSG